VPMILTSEKETRWYNLVLLLKKTISGKVVLSNGVAPEGGYTVKVKASGSKEVRNRPL